MQWMATQEDQGSPGGRTGFLGPHGRSSRSNSLAGALLALGQSTGSYNRSAGSSLGYAGKLA